MDEWKEKSEVEWLGLKLLRISEEHPEFEYCDGQLRVHLEVGGVTSESYMQVRIVFSEEDPSEDVLIYSKAGFPLRLLQESADEVKQVIEVLGVVAK